MKGCGKCPWHWAVPFRNCGAINCKYWCVLHDRFCADVKSCRTPGGEGLRGPAMPLPYYARKKERRE